MILQAIYLWKVDELNGNMIAITSMIFSIISIMTTIASVITNKKILDSSGYAIVQFDITGSSIIAKTKSCRNQVNVIKNQLSSLLGLEEYLMEILRPQKIPNGLRMMIIIHVNRISVNDIDYKKLLDEAQQNGELAKAIQNSWNLGDDFIITPISFRIKESKQWIQNTIPIKINSISTGLDAHIHNNNLG